MMQRPLGSTGVSASILGLGCSRIASMRTRPSPREILALLDRAVTAGISFFDTADIYGQGDSERVIGQALAGRRERAVICTKAGLTLRSSQTLVRLAKPVMRPLLRRVGALDRAVAETRRRSEDTDFDPGHLRRRLEGSLRRLRTDHVDVFLLHSPPLESLEDGRLYDLLDTIRRDGLARSCGVSCCSLADAAAVIDHGRAACLEVPLSAGELGQAAPVLERAAGKGVGLIAREIFSGLPVGPAPSQGVYARALEAVLARPEVAVTLVGTTSRANLDASLAVVEGFERSGRAAGASTPC